MNQTNRRTLRRVLDLRLAQLQATDVQELQTAARETGGLDDVLTVTQLSQVTPQRFAAWQADAEQLLRLSLTPINSQTSAKE